MLNYTMKLSSMHLNLVTKWSSSWFEWIQVLCNGLDILFNKYSPSIQFVCIKMALKMIGLQVCHWHSFPYS